MIEEKINTVICGDCLKIMEEFQDKSVTIITDPVWPNTTADIPGKDDPYGLFASSSREFGRIAKRLIVHLGTDSDPRILAPIPQTLPFIRTVDLSYARPHYKGRILYGNDIAYIFGEVPISAPNKRVLPGRFCHSTNEKIKYPHPCPRRLSHVQFLVEFFSEPNDIILDPFCGSGTTLEAAIRCGRKFIGIDIKQEYVDMSITRARAAQNQLTLNL